jgi:carbamoyl-phosphate synthase large subunit
MKILIVSVGSLVGQNILDVLDYAEFNRRKYVTVFGTNSVASNSNNFRCDKCFLVPNTADKDFLPEITNIIKNVEPDLILCGRDEDTEVLWKLMHDSPDLPGVLPYGELSTVLYALDKWQTWKFTQKHMLPFAETFLLDDSISTDELKEFCSRVGYPLIAKPARGFASKGVFFVRNWDDALIAREYKGYILQEYLGEKDANKKYFESFERLVPLFAHAPNIYHFSCHTFVYPDGAIAPIFISQNMHDSGVTIGFSKVFNEELESLAIKYAKALWNEGGAGPVTIQFRKDKKGEWKAQEMNMRTNGNTFPRMLLGQDDLSMIINTFVANAEFPAYTPLIEHDGAIFTKTLIATPITKAQLNCLNTTKSWPK